MAFIEILLLLNNSTREDSNNFDPCFRFVEVVLLLKNLTAPIFLFFLPLSFTKYSNENEKDDVEIV